MFGSRLRRVVATGRAVAASKRRLCTNASLSLPEVQQIFRRCEAVCFDVDSTVIREEGIDVLANHCGKGDAVAELTRSAMGGSVLFQDALRMRLDMLKPTKQTIEECIVQRPFEFTAGVQQLIAALHSSGKHVFLISGGFRIVSAGLPCYCGQRYGDVNHYVAFHQMIEPIAQQLHIPKERIIANSILFHEDGTYKSFDPTEFTSRDRGKPAAIEWLTRTYGYQEVVMIGDGVTDMQAKPPAAAFIGFGGVVARKPVQEGADWFITSFEEILKLL